MLFVIQDEPDQTPASQAHDLIERIAAAKAGCGGMDCVVGGGFVHAPCLPNTALGALFGAMGSAAVVEALPADPSEVTAETFTPVLRDVLAQVIAEKCLEIAPAG